MINKVWSGSFLLYRPHTNYGTFFLQSGQVMRQAKRFESFLSVLRTLRFFTEYHLKFPCWKDAP